MPRRWRPRDDTGQALVLVLVVSSLVVIFLTAVVGSVVSGLATSTTYARTNQAQLAAQTGVATELASMRAVPDYQALPCSGSGSISLAGATSSYSTAITYYGAGSKLTCNGSTLGGTTAPSLAHIASTGSATGGLTSQVVADTSISVATVTGSFPGDAIFTEGSAQFANSTNLAQSTYGTPNVYAGGLLSCSNGIFSQGTMITYDSTDVLNLNNTCQFTNIVGAGAIVLSGGASATGYVTSYGTTSASVCGGTVGVCVSRSVQVGGNVTAIGTNAGIGVINQADVKGNADAEGLITLQGSGSIAGSKTQNDSSLGSRFIDTDYPPLTFPSYDPTALSWAAAGWSVQVVGQPGYPTCSSYFADTATDTFMQQIAGALVPLAIYAPTCNVSYSQAHAFQLGSNIALQVESFSVSQLNTFDPTTEGTKTAPVSVDFALLAGAEQKCSTSTLDITFSQNTAFAPIPVTDPYSTVNTLLYTEGEISMANSNIVYGQIFACGGFSTNNAVSLTFDPLAGDLLNSQAGPVTPTIAVKDKYAN
jgi:hypothetical protein